MIILNVFLMGFVTATIAGLLVWSIWTQHRDHGCADIRVRRRFSIG